MCGQFNSVPKSHIIVKNINPKHMVDKNNKAMRQTMHIHIFCPRNSCSICCFHFGPKTKGGQIDNRDALINNVTGHGMKRRHVL